MQVGSSVNSCYYQACQSNRRVFRSGNFILARNSDIQPTSTDVPENIVPCTDSKELYEMQRRTGKKVVLDKQQGTSEAVTVAECEEKGELLGITMIPEEGQSVTYGMRAMLNENATPGNPIVQVISNLGGQKKIYNVDISKVDPQNATQLEMFALLSYMDKVGLTDGGTFGSFHQLKVYSQNASYRGYCSDLSGGDVFLNEKFDWTEILERIKEDYLEAEIYNQYEDCKKLVDYLGKFASQKQTDTKEKLEQFQKELLQKIKNGNAETAYQIGAQEFTEKEWEAFLEQFDSIEDAIRELMRERHARELEPKEEQTRGNRLGQTVTPNQV